jgi:hypothetical protein
MRNHIIVPSLPKVAFDQKNRRRMLNRKVQRRLRAKKYKLLKRTRPKESRLTTMRFK